VHPIRYPFSATLNTDLRDPLHTRTHLSFTERDRETGDDGLLLRASGKTEEVAVRLGRPAGGSSGGEGGLCSTKGPMRTHRCTRHGLACSEEAGPRAPVVSSCAAAAGCAPVVTLAKGEVREVRHEGRKVVQWFDLVKECLVVADHRALRLSNGGQGDGVLRRPR
jgi:hypothetical protein